jgi:putative transposase
MIRHAWIGAHADVTQKRQCMLAGVSRTTVYVKRKPVVFVESDEVLKRLIDEGHTRHPFYGSRKMVVYLGRCGHLVNRKRVQRLMRCMSLAGMASGPNTCEAHPLHKVYPCLLRGVLVVRANQVCCHCLSETVCVSGRDSIFLFWGVPSWWGLLGLEF